MIKTLWIAIRRVFCYGLLDSLLFLHKIINCHSYVEEEFFINSSMLYL